MDKDQIYLSEIKEFCEKIIAFTSDKSHEDFVKDEKLYLAVMKMLVKPQNV